MNRVKLFEVSILDDAEWSSTLKVGKSKEQVESLIWKEDYLYSCLSFVKAIEVTEVDGHKIVVLS